MPNYYHSNMEIIRLGEEKAEARMWARIMLARWVAAEKRNTELKAVVGDKILLQTDVRLLKSLLCQWIDYISRHVSGPLDDDLAALLFQTGAAVADKPL